MSDAFGFLAEIVMRAASRFWRVVYDNSAYGLTAWRWDSVLGAMLLIGLAVQLFPGK